MKSLKISLLALSVLAGGIMVANAASKTDVGQTLQVLVKFATNAGPSFIEVEDEVPANPKALSTNGTANVYVNTDGAGKLEGAGWIRIEYKTLVITPGSTNTPSVTNFITTSYSDYITDITGKLSTKNDAPSAQMTLKGQGYITAVNPTNWSGGISQKAASATESKLNLKFTSSGAAVVINTNGPVYGLTGTYKGSVTGIDGKTAKVDESSVLKVNYSKPTDLDLALVSWGKKFTAITADGSFIGSANVSSSDKFTLNMKGVGSSRGSSLKMNGTVGDQNIIIVGQTNTVLSLTSLTLDGKVMGQTIKDVSATAVAR